jgi:hypothetical protein
MRPPSAGPGFAGPAQPDTCNVSAPQQDKGQQQAFLETLNLIDIELCCLKDGGQIPLLFSKLKSLIINDLFSTVKAVEKRVASASNPTNSYASAVRAGLQQPVPSPKPIPLRDLREIYIQRADVCATDIAKPLDCIIRDVNNEFARFNIGRILNARKLQSGDLVLLADSSDTKRRAEAKKEEWLDAIGMGAGVKLKRHTVYVHSVKVDSFDMAKQEQGIQKIYEQNPAIKGKVQILRFHWRRHVLRQKKAWSALLIDIASPQGGNNLIEEGLVLDGELKDVELFDALCLVTRCYNCQGYGHSARFCRRPQRCGHCAAPGHDTGACPVKGQKAKRRCANCQLEHGAGSPSCATQQRELARAQRAREAKPRLFMVPALGTPPPTDACIFDTVAITGKRPAEPLGNASERVRKGRVVDDEGWIVPTASRKQRGRPSQPLATASDGCISSFLTSSAKGRLEKPTTEPSRSPSGSVRMSGLELADSLSQTPLSNNDALICSPNTSSCMDLVIADTQSINGF